MEDTYNKYVLPIKEAKKITLETRLKREEKLHNQIIEELNSLNTKITNAANRGKQHMSVIYKLLPPYSNVIQALQNTGYRCGVTLVTHNHNDYKYVLLISW